MYKQIKICSVNESTYSNKIDLGKNKQKCGLNLSEKSS